MAKQISRDKGGRTTRNKATKKIRNKQATGLHNIFQKENLETKIEMNPESEANNLQPSIHIWKLKLELDHQKDHPMKNNLQRVGKIHKYGTPIKN